MDGENGQTVLYPYPLREHNVPRSSEYDEHGSECEHEPNEPNEHELDESDDSEELDNSDEHEAVSAHKNESGNDEQDPNEYHISKQIDAADGNSSKP